MIVTAHAGVLHHPAGHARIGLLVCYWAVLSFTAQRLCILIARYARTAHLPTTRRLRASATLIGAGLSLAAGQSLIALIRTAPGTGSLTLARHSACWPPPPSARAAICTGAGPDPPRSEPGSIRPARHGRTAPGRARQGGWRKNGPHGPAAVGRVPGSVRHRRR